jgi:hypothetical protein
MTINDHTTWSSQCELFTIHNNTSRLITSNNLHEVFMHMIGDGPKDFASMDLAASLATAALPPWRDKARHEKEQE